MASSFGRVRKRNFPKSPQEVLKRDRKKLEKKMRSAEKQEGNELEWQEEAERQQEIIDLHKLLFNADFGEVKEIFRQIETKKYSKSSEGALLLDIYRISEQLAKDGFKKQAEILPWRNVTTYR